MEPPNSSPMHNAAIVRYGEISLKGKNRIHFERQLQADIIRFFKKNGTIYDNVLLKRGRIYINGLSDRPDLKRVFGIFSYSYAMKIDRDFELLKDTVAQFFEQVQKSRSFRVSCQRVDKSFPMTSVDVERQIGEVLYEGTGVPVHLKDPDLDFQIEIGEDGIYLFHERERAYGGMPYGSAGKLGVLISGGIDSPVAAFLMMKRGVEPVLIHYKITDSDAEKVVKIKEKLEEYASGREIKLIITDRDDIFKGKFTSLYNNRKYHSYVCVMCKYLMHINTKEIAKREKLLGLITGDNLAQVASQTLKNLYAYRMSSGLPIYSPLISFDKIETIEIAKKIGTYDISIRKSKGCEPPKNPKTGVSPEVFSQILKDSGVLD